MVSALNKFATSNIGTKLYKWAAGEKGQKWLCESLPTCETVFATSAYIYATERQKLTRREKNVLQWQNILPAIIGICVGTYLNKKVFKLGDKIIDKLDPTKIPEPHKIKGAIRVALPLATTAILMRWALPVATAFISGEIEEHKARKKLDTKV